MKKWRNALRRNIAANSSDRRLKSDMIDVELAINVTDMFRPRGGMSHTEVFTLFGIHGTKYDEFLS